MKPYILKLFSIYICFSLFSCNTNSVKNEYYNKYKNKCKIELIGKKEISLDENTSSFTMFMQYIDNIDKLSLYNKYNNSIYLFDYNTGKLYKKIQFEKEGNNGVGKLQGYDYINEDSIFVYNRHTKIVSLMNEASQLKWKRRLNIDSLQSYTFMPSFPYLQTNSPMIYINKKLILGGFGTAETTAETSTNSPVTTIYNFEGDSISFANNYPEQYQKYNWGGGFFRMPYFDVNKANETIILSFPQDHYLYVYSLLTKKQKKYYAGSASIREIEAYPEKKELRTNINQDRASEWFFSIPTYRSVLYDKYRNLYYRLVTFPNDPKFDKFTYCKQPLLLIILDKDFNYLGESLLPDNIDLFFTNSFVTKEGFNIQAITDNEDLLTFYQFKVLIHE